MAKFRITYTCPDKTGKGKSEGEVTLTGTDKEGVRRKFHEYIKRARGHGVPHTITKITQVKEENATMTKETAFQPPTGVPKDARWLKRKWKLGNFGPMKPGTVFDICMTNHGSFLRLGKDTHRIKDQDYSLMVKRSESAGLKLESLARLKETASVDEVIENLLTGKATGLTFSKGKDGGGFEIFEAPIEGGSTAIKFNSVTLYKVKNRLRDPSKTSYKVYATIAVYKGKHLLYTKTKLFGSATGESRGSEDKVEQGKLKAIAWAKKQGIDINKFSFAY